MAIYLKVMLNSFTYSKLDLTHQQAVVQQYLLFLESSWLLHMKYNRLTSQRLCFLWLWGSVRMSYNLAWSLPHLIIQGH